MTQKTQQDFNKTFQEELEKLNEAQRRAVEHIEGPVLVIAGPGTGKTQIIAARIGNILINTDTQPENILCLTYTDAGTIAMRKRLLQFIGPIAYRVNIYTFHAFCNEVIQSNPDYFGKRNLEPISDLENIDLLRSILDELAPAHPLKRLKGDIYYDVKRLNNLFKTMKDENWSPEKIIQSIDSYIADLPTRDKFIYKKANSKEGRKKGDVKQKAIDDEKEKMEVLRAAAELFPVYQKKMIAENRYDYSDMIQWVVKAFQENENLLRSYQERYLYFLVDEFQDTNGSQNEILKLLTSYWDKPNCFAVGDDDQSIYEFQGARVKNIMDFYELNKQHIESIVLTENYRSTQKILDASKVLIDYNQERLTNKIQGLDKTLIAKNKDVINSTVTPVITEYPNIAQEETGILKQIEALYKQGFPLNEVAVIYHRHTQAENLIHLMDKRNIPYQVKKKIDIINLPLIQNILTILQYIDAETHKPHSGERQLFEMMHYHFFNIHLHDIATLAVYMSSNKKDNNWRSVLSDKKILSQIRLKDPDSLEKFEKNITRWLSNANNLTLQMLFEEILNDSGLLKYILQSSEKIWLMEVVTTFFDFLKEEGSKNPRLKIRDLLEMVEKMRKHEIGLPVNKIIFSEQGVNFVTAHSSKGLEFQYVFLLGCTRDKWEINRGGTSRNFSLPDTLTFSKEENKEEALRRLFYVAITRAKEHLHISYPSEDNKGNKLEKSRFVAEVSEGTKLEEQKKSISPEELFEAGVSALQKNDKPPVEFFDSEFIRQRVENFEMSVSALNSYLSCPLSFFFEKVLRVPEAKSDSMAFGSAVHYAIDRLFKRMKESNGQFPDKEEFVNNFAADMFRQKDAFTDKQFENRLALGKQILPKFYDKYVHTWNKVVVTEHRIDNIEVDGIPVKGVFDKVEFYGKDVNVVDYKTGSVKQAKSKLEPPSDKNPLGGDYWRQIIFYKILMDNDRIHQWNMVSGEIDFVEMDDNEDFRKEKIQVTPEAIDIVKEQLKTAYTKIKNLEFTDGCGKSDCYWCNFVKDNKIALTSLQFNESVNQ